MGLEIGLCTYPLNSSFCQFMHPSSPAVKRGSKDGAREDIPDGYQILIRILDDSRTQIPLSQGSGSKSKSSGVNVSQSK